MGAGKYRHRVTIQRDDGTTDDSYGAPTADWTALYENVPAEIDTGGSMKFYTAHQVEQTMTHMVTVRWIQGLDITDPLRIVWGTRTFDVLGPPIDAKGKRQELEFRCVEHVS